jgi:hypothetical protein
MTDDEAEFERRMRALGLNVPPDLLEGALCVHRELSRMTQLVRRPRDPEVEPAYSFSVRQIGQLPDC